MVIACLSLQNLSLCWSLNDEGLALLRFKERITNDPFNALSNWKDENGEIDHCFWFGVECSSGKVVVLNLRDLCLGGTLAPELTHLVHIKSIILRNNSFTGVIPEGMGKLEDLEMLDLGYNNFSGPVPVDLGSNLSLAILLLDNNRLLGRMSPELHELKMLSEFQVDEDELSGAAKASSCNQRPNVWNLNQGGDFIYRRLMQIPRRGVPPPPPPTSNVPSVAAGVSPGSSPSPSPSPSSSGRVASESNKTLPSPPPSSSTPPASTEIPSLTKSKSSSSKNNTVAILAGAIGGAFVLMVAIIGYLCVKTKVTIVRPWATGLSGQLQKAFVSGVPNLKRTELVTACEDFSNVIDSSSIGTLYKGTLSNGVEIAVASVAATSARDWSENLELQFLKKIDLLSKVNHKNFVNLIGYCQEDEPFTRMMVFEYAPNGTLFEHLHIREAEHLDWGMRLRITMGMAYCLDFMHQLEQPIPHNNLSSSAIRLTEDYAAKIAEFSFLNEMAAMAPMESLGIKKLPSRPSTSLECNVYSFGVILFEMVTGRLPYSVDNSSLEDWAADYLRGDQPLREMVDPTLSSYQEEQLELIGEVIKSCGHPDPRRRPTMREVCVRLREITGITPDGASPRLSPLWWAEIELMSTEAI